MNVQEALNILEIKPPVCDRSIIKKHYRKLANKYHPDRNEHGLKMMQDVNMAYDYLAKVADHILFTFSSPPPPKEPLYMKILKEKNLRVYHDGIKIWVTGNTYPHKEELKKYKFRWDPDEKKWWKYK